MSYKRRQQSELPSVIALFVILVILLGLGLPFLFQSTEILLYGTIILGVLILGSGVAFLVYLSWKQRQRLRALTIANIDTMAGEVFERYVGELLKFQGYIIQYTPTSGDYGVDIVARRGTGAVAVQIKRYKGLVGREAISDAVAGMNYYRCNKSMVVTNSYFTPNAKQLAQVNNCELVDRETLTEWILDFQKDPKQSLN